jgi:hypothetical protein
LRASDYGVKENLFWCRHLYVASAESDGLFAVFANFLFLPYAIFMPPLSHYGNSRRKIPEVRGMGGQAQYYLSVELIALEQHLDHSLNRVSALRDTALKLNDRRSVDRIGKLQKVIGAVQTHLTRLK